jgi:hypothetical protein
MYKYLLAFLLFLSTSIYGGEYHAPVNLPACDINNSEVAIIDSVAGFSQVNDPAKKVFCIEPGNYDVPLDLSQSGAEGESRFLRYYNPSEIEEIHPANMDETDRAVVKTLYFLGSHHWIVDRLTVRNPDQYAFIRMQTRLPYNPHWADDVNHIVLNRLLVEESGGSAGMIAMGGYNLTVQDSVVRNSFITPNQDDHCLVFYGNNNAVVGNEIYNCAGDMIQISIGGGIAGGIIAENELYVTPEYRSDGQGNLDPNGEFLCAENALDAKGAGTPESPLLVTGNKIWGFDREDDPTCATSGGGYIAVINHFNTTHMLFKDNIIYDSGIGLIFANPTVNDSTYADNLFHNLDIAFAVPESKGFDNKYHNNIFSDVRINFQGAGTNNEFIGNTVLEGQRCFLKYQITNPTKVCIGVAPPTAEEVVNHMLELRRASYGHKVYQPTRN